MKFSTLVLLGLIAISDTEALKIYKLEEPEKGDKKEEAKGEPKGEAKGEEKAEGKETAKKEETSSGDNDCYEHPYGSDKQQKCVKDQKDQIEQNGIDSYNRQLKDDEAHEKKNNEY